MLLVDALQAAYLSGSSGSILYFRLDLAGLPEFSNLLTSS